ncbi:MAG: AraC family transcriptional regulator [Prosthecobacter sp.]|nr:AraC family transcriptional regulator [Prosthecobacter sp.]
MCFEFHSRWLGVDAWTTGSWIREISETSVMLLLVLSGEIRIGWPKRPAQDFRPGTVIWINAAVACPDRCGLLSAMVPEVLQLLFPIEWIHSSLGNLRQELSADFQALLLGPYPPTPMILRPLEAEDRVWARGLMASTLCSGARRLLEGSRMSEFFFRKVLMEARGEEMFCTRTRKLALERVAKVREALLSNLENPPALDNLARLCGCHPQYLSRTFSEVAGTTISLYLRRLRIERAAELISTGRMNASEAALEVGYRSLSHFSQAFRAEKGCPPSLWARSGHLGAARLG